MDLITRVVGEIDEKFIVPAYQRGYRWGKEEIDRLLDDIYESSEKIGDPNYKYCLQPVAVRKEGEKKYILIDGQQRLTSLYLIYCYIYSKNPDFYPKPGFSITYETRPESEEFLKNINCIINDDARNRNIDFSFMATAYEAIDAWFRKEGKYTTRVNKISELLEEKVQIIWYEVDSTSRVQDISVFTKLNVGKIPLTNSELVKALFLSNCQNGDMSMGRKEEISLQWDNIEKELHNESFWSFLSNDNDGYQTRIDLVLDLIVNTPADNRDKYYTFFKFNEMKKKKETLKDVWDKINGAFLMLKGWFENHELYHKIGYLIASRSQTLQNIFNCAEGKKTKDFKKDLDSLIQESVAPKDGLNYAEYSYERPVQKTALMKLLLLFNVESVRKNGEESQWFPFAKFKFGEGKGGWSLEHIHAQQSVEIKPMYREEWLRLHIPSIEIVGDSDLVYRMKNAAETKKLSNEDFAAIQTEVIRKLSEDSSVEELHTISNLALLNVGDNAALSNSTFDVKRRKVIEMDKKGRYIPYCTKMVFLKYYTSSGESQLHFWGHQDRTAYIESMNDVLKDYLSGSILVENREN